MTSLLLFDSHPLLHRCAGERGEAAAAGLAAIPLDAVPLGNPVPFDHRAAASLVRAFEDVDGVDVTYLFVGELAVLGVVPLLHRRDQEAVELARAEKLGVFV